MGVEYFCYWFRDNINGAYYKNISKTCQENAKISLAKATFEITVVCCINLLENYELGQSFIIFCSKHSTTIVLSFIDFWLISFQSMA